MAVPLIGGEGLFDKLGTLFGTTQSIDAHLAQLVTDIQTDIRLTYIADPDLAGALLGNLESIKATAASNNSAVQIAARKTVIEMVNDDNPLSVKSLKEALIELIFQMGTDDDVDGSTASGEGNTAPDSGTGNGRLILDVTDGEGNNKEYIVAEDIAAICTSDSQTSGTKGRETFSVKGEASIVSRFSELWPEGSGGSRSVQVTDPALDASRAVGKNRLTNSSFEAFTSDVPDNWQLDTGVAGTNITATTTEHRGTNALSIVGDGTTNFELTQEFDNSLETPSPLLKQRRYCFGLWIRDDGTTPASGDLTMSIVGVSGSTVIDLTAIDSTYTLYTFVFSTPLLLLASPMQAKLQLTTLLTSPREVFVDSAFVAEMFELYQGGPNFLIVPGSTEYIKDDKFVQAIANDGAGLFQAFFDRFYDMRGLGLRLPSQTDGSETIDDALIT